MRLLVSWLRDFVDVPVLPAELATMLSMRGFEVAAIEAAPGGPIRPDPSSGAAAGLPAEGPDAVIDLEITANRPDCLGVVALAREVATAYGLPLRPLHAVFPACPLPDGSSSGAAGAEAALPGLRVVIEDAGLCPRYASAIVDVRQGPSPAWLANRLEAAGIRSISGIVDVTNYVLIETGHPMHAFDLARLRGGEIRIRRARPAERLRTLDGEDRALDGEMLVIADAADAHAIAGVMGGATSEVWGGTRVIAFESAYFQPTSVRRVSKRTGLKTEASARFERGADVSAPPIALERAIALVEAIGAGRARPGRIDCYPAPRTPARVPLRRSRIAHVLGAPVDDTSVRRILEGLGFAPQGTPDGWIATVPTERVDVAREEDLIEEVARHHGYDRLPTTLPVLARLPPGRPPALDRQRLLRRVLTGAGFWEVQTYAFLEARAAVPYAAGLEPVAISYPLSEKFASLRPSLVPGLLDAVAVNRNRGTRDVRMFELGSVFAADTGERHRLGLIWTGAAVGEHWSSGARPVDFFDLKGAVAAVCEALGLDVEWEPLTRPELVRGRAAAVKTRGAVLGTLGQLVPSLADARGLQATDEVYVAELDLDLVERVAPAGDVRAVPPPRFPPVIRDVALLVKDSVPASAIRRTICAAAPSILAGVEEFDRYQGPNIPEGHVSLAFHLTFRSLERTLVDVEVQQAIDAIVAALGRDHDAVQR